MRGDRPPSSKEVGWWLSGCLLLAPQISEGPCLTTQCVALSHVLIALFCYLLHIFHDTHVSYVYLLIISSLEKTWIPQGPDISCYGCMTNADTMPVTQQTGAEVQFPELLLLRKWYGSKEDASKEKRKFTPTTDRKGRIWTHCSPESSIWAVLTA